MRRIIVATLFLLQFAASASAAELNEVTWILPEFPPFFITEPALQGQGYGDGELRYLTGHLTQFHHAVLYATPVRLWHEMEHRDAVCTISAAKLPEREAFALFSARATLGTTNDVIVRSDRLARFQPFLDKNGHIDLNRLAADTTLTGSYSSGSSYGPVIDSFIKNPNRKTPLEQSPHMRLPLSLVDKGRLDFVFGYYMEMAYYRRTHPGSADFTSLPTTPEPQRQDGYVVCSKGPRGREIIAAIDALLAPNEAMLDYVENLRSWYSPSEMEAVRKAVISGDR